jgi:hypothetical protein
VTVNGAALTIADDAGTAFDLDVAGSLVIDSNHALAGAGAVRFTGTYKWSAAASPAIPTASWADGSVCLIEDTNSGGDGNTTGISGQSYYDLQVNHPGYARRLRLNFLSGTTTIRRHFTINIPDVASASVGLGDGSNVVVSVGGNVTFATGATANTTKVLMKRAAGDTFVLQVGGNLAMSGFFDAFGASPEKSVLEFNGATQSLTVPTGANMINGARLTYQVNSGSTVTLGAPIDASTNIVVNGVLNCGVHGLTIFPGKTLSGTGTIQSAAPFGTAANTVLAPGNDNIGTLTFAGGVNLSCTNTIEVNNAGPLNDVVSAGSGALAFGGPIRVVNLGAPLVAGNSFPAFSAGSFSGAPSSITPAPGAGLAWDTVAVVTTGALAVHANPVAAADQASVAHGQTTTIAAAKLLANDTGELGETLSITAVSANASLAGGIVTYTAPTSGTTDTITYTLSDGRGGSTTGTINVTLASSGSSFNQLTPNVLGNGDIQLNYLGIPGTNYAVEITHDLTPPVTWTPLKTNAAGPNGALTFTNTPSGGNDFYRTRYVP